MLLTYVLGVFLSGMKTPGRTEKSIQVLMCQRANTRGGSWIDHLCLWTFLIIIHGLKGWFLGGHSCLQLLCAYLYTPFYLL